MSTARLHRCQFCTETHAELTRIASAGEIDPADPNSVRRELAAVLVFLEQLTRTPEGVSGSDLEELRKAAVPDEAIVDALYVKLIWDTINRLANVFDYQLSDGQLIKGTRALHRFGYRFPKFLTGKSNRPSDSVGIEGRHRGLVAQLRQAVFESPAETDPAIRARAATGGLLPEAWEAYALNVREESSGMTDTDIDRLKAAGHSEDEIFEVTIAAAVGAALRGLNAGLSVVRGGG